MMNWRSDLIQTLDSVGVTKLADPDMTPLVSYVYRSGFISGMITACCVCSVGVLLSNSDKIKVFKGRFSKKGS